MTWLKIDDGFSDHPKVMRVGNEAVGVFARTAAWSASHNTDGLVPAAVVTMYGGLEQLTPTVVRKLGGGPRVIRERLLEARLWEPGELGGIVVHDFLRYNPSRNEVEGERARRAELRDPEIVAAVRLRDGDLCRYCGRAVKWSDRRGEGGGTYDHVVPDLVAGVDNIVVACRACNARKGRRTPAEAGMTLLPVPGAESRLRSVPRSEPESGAGSADVTPGRVGTGSGRVGQPVTGRVGPRRPAEAGAVTKPGRGAGRCPEHHVDLPCSSCPPTEANPATGAP